MVSDICIKLASPYGSELCTAVVWKKSKYMRKTILLFRIVSTLLNPQTHGCPTLWKNKFTLGWCL